MSPLSHGKETLISATTVFMSWLTIWLFFTLEFCQGFVFLLSVSQLQLQPISSLQYKQNTVSLRVTYTYRDRNSTDNPLRFKWEDESRENWLFSIFEGLKFCSRPNVNVFIVFTYIFFWNNSLLYSANLFSAVKA